MDDLVEGELAGLPGLARGPMNPSVGSILRQPATDGTADPDSKGDFTWAIETGMPADYGGRS